MSGECRLGVVKIGVLCVLKLGVVCHEMGKVCAEISLDGFIWGVYVVRCGPGSSVLQ